jgi:hypothetical protein
MTMIKLGFGLLSGALLATMASAGGVTVGVEAPRAQSTLIALTGKQVATFDGFNGYIGGGTNIFAGAPISGTIVEGGGFNTWGANVYGGAGGTGQYATVYNTTSIKLSAPVTYAGLWGSAIDGDFSTSLGNTVALYSGDTLLGSFALKPLLAGASTDYYGNPNAPWQGQDSWEPFAFFNFTSASAFDRIDIVQNGGGGFELDNITIGNAIGHHGGDNSTAAVPEPASWAMMLVGFGAMGAVMRMRRRAASLV